MLHTPVRSTFTEARLTSHRLLLRPFERGDITDTYLACADELTQRWLPTLPRPYTAADAERWCTAAAHLIRTSGLGVQFAVTDLDDQRLLGAVGLNRTDWRTRTSEVGYWVAPWARGTGIAAEATRALACWALKDQEFERLELRADGGNVASCKAADRAGFHREGVLRSAGVGRGRRYDLVMYSLLPADL